MSEDEKPSADAAQRERDRALRESLSRLLKQSSEKLRRHVVTGDQLPQRDASLGASGGAAALRRGAARPVDLAALCPGRIIEAAEGACYLVEGPVDGFSPVPDDFENQYRRTFLGGGANVSVAQLHATVQPLLQSPPEGIAYLDIETCGMAGMAVFLVGLLVWRDGRLTVRQFLARDYSEERAMLARVWEELAAVGVLVTFNGLAFDVPFIQDRAAAVGLARRTAGALHVDMLHESRRRWKAVLPNCRLQTLERFICGRLRSGDIPGDQIPGVYHEFVRTGDARQIEVVLRHNALDLITLAELTIRVLQNRDGDWP